MNILVFDTSTNTLAAGVAKADGGMTTCLESGFKHAEILLPAIERCLETSSLRLADMGLIACASGPGSFTGLRIGMATAKGLSLALGLPWVGIPTLDGIAHEWARDDRVIVPILDARKNRVYSALYRHGQRMGDYLDVSIAELLAMLDGEEEVAFVGPDADIFADYALERPGFVIERNDPAKTLKGLAILAELRFREKGGALDDEGPLYLREPEIG